MSTKSTTTSLKVKAAQYLEAFRISIAFNNGKKKVVDFKPFLDTLHGSHLEKYKKPAYFKKFTVEAGNVVWGKDWDLIFPVDQLYSGKIIIAD